MDHSKLMNTRSTSYPLSKNQLSVTLDGLFGLSPEWQALEEANPGFFLYEFSFP